MVAQGKFRNRSVIGQLVFPFCGGTAILVNHTAAEWYHYHDIRSDEGWISNFSPLGRFSFYQADKCGVGISLDELL